MLSCPGVCSRFITSVVSFILRILLGTIFTTLHILFRTQISSRNIFIPWWKSLQVPPPDFLLRHVTGTSLICCGVSRSTPCWLPGWSHLRFVDSVAEPMAVSLMAATQENFRQALIPGNRVKIGFWHTKHNILMICTTTIPGRFTFVLFGIIIVVLHQYLALIVEFSNISGRACQQRYLQGILWSI